MQARYLCADALEQLGYQAGARADDADATLTLTGNDIFSIISKNEELQKSIQVDGDKEIISKLTENMSGFEYFFNIVEP